MTKPKTITLAADEYVIAVVPECCDGPGWSNSPTWVYIQSSGKTVRTECIQPHERTPELHTLFAAGERMCAALRDAVPTRDKK